MSDSEDELLAIERERLKLQQIQLQLQLQIFKLQQKTYKRANRSWLERLEDGLFDW